MKKLLMGLMTMLMLFGACAQADYQAGRAAEHPESYAAAKALMARLGMIPKTSSAAACRA